MLSKIIDKTLSVLVSMVLGLVVAMLATWIPMLITDLIVSTFDVEISFTVWSVDYAKMCGFWTWILLWGIIFAIDDNTETRETIPNQDDAW